MIKCGKIKEKRKEKKKKKNKNGIDHINLARKKEWKMFDTMSIFIIIYNR